MIYTTDLDKTLIFTEKWVTSGIEVHTAEHREGTPFTYMTPKAYEYLKEIAKHTLFIPNTARTLAQIQRIGFIHELNPEYIVALNGIEIYYKGDKLREWDEEVRRKTQNLQISMEEAAELIRKHIKGIVNEYRFETYTTVFGVDTKAIDLVAYEQMKEELARHNWLLYLQGRKLYVVPLAVNKGEALKFINHREGHEHIIGAGDSFFDIPLLQECTARYSLEESELKDIPVELDIYWSSKGWLEGSEEMLKTIIEKEIKGC